jgi:hypothetical protein
VNRSNQNPIRDTLLIFSVCYGKEKIMGERERMLEREMMMIPPPADR